MRFQVVLLAAVRAAIATLLITVPNIGAADTNLGSTDPDVEFVQGLMQVMTEPPGSNADAIERIVEEFKEGNSRHMEQIVQSTPASVVGALVQSLETNTADQAVLLLQQLERNEASYLKFLAVTQAEIAKDPTRLERMQRAVDEIRSRLLARRIGSPPFSDRTIQASMIVIGLAAWLYGTDSALYSLSPKMEFAVQYFPHAMATYLGMVVFNDIRAFRNSWRQYFAKIRDRRFAKKNIEAIQKIISALKKSPEIRPAASNYSYFASRKSEQILPTAFAKLTSNFIQEVERLNLEPQAWAQAQAFQQSRQYFQIVEGLNQSLSEHEKKTLNDRLENQGLALPFVLNAKVMHYEAQVLSAFGRWLSDRNVVSKDSGRLSALLSERENDMDLTLAQTAPRNSFNFLTLTLGLGLAVLGLDATLAADPGPLFQSDFFMSLRDFFQHNHGRILRGFSNAIWLSTAVLMWEHVAHIRVLRRLKSDDPPFLGHLSPLLRLFTRKNRLGDVETTSCEDLLK